MLFVAPPFIDRFDGWIAGARRAANVAGRALLDFALPPQCLACAKPVTEAGGLCVACWSGLRLIERPYCERLGAPFPADYGPGLLSPAAIANPPAYDRARAVARFDGAARELVHRLKYADGVHLARPLGAMMARAGHELLTPETLVLPVPLHRGRLWRRRFNQAALLAREAARATKAELRADLLLRVKATRPQVGLTAAQRAENLAGAFRIADGAAAALRGRRVVLVDDVLTTGATVDRLSRLVRRAGASSVDVLVFALVVKDG
ncbi:amidophosphoribosyltransferase [Hansschlegelia plantiphila]|uniref:Amidophosphoribosyltransferase n=1 Tax=Hansschlegelia plantiphila TaxID=374655 RepID=A0A9W6J0G1_9HYPH|nr:ComF family protein [Hansschlegelia plantiphila]GLK68447.1 amidophosphoribosyltransferase [Hansschlegelia plantiphila]